MTADPSKQGGAPQKRMAVRYRGLITKGEELRYVSHLDYANLFVRACKRAGLPMVYSEGFNPHMKVAFASALSAGADTRVSVTVGSVFFVGVGDAVEEGSGYFKWLAVLEGLGVDEEFSL